MRHGSARARTRTQANGPTLRAVPSSRGRTHSRQSRRPIRGAEARCRSVFTTAVVLLVALTALGLVRVAVIARAAEMTMSADRLSRRIKDQRVQTDQLEIDRSSLSTPSRIGGIASDTMQMGDPASVSYMDMPVSEDDATQLAASGAGALRSSAVVEPVPVGGKPVPSGAARLSAVLGTLMDVSAGEAQSLLVGDLGLAGSR